MKQFAALLLALPCAWMAAPAAGQTEATPAGQRPLPQQQTENGVKYMCGGIGMIEAARMRQIASDYDLMLTFAAADGAYLADIDVEIAGAKGQKIVAARCSGPLMLVDLPQAGTYRITAETEGQRVVRTARARDGESGQRILFTWPVSDGGRSSASTP